MDLPIGSYLGWAMVGAEPILKATSIDLYSSSWPPTTPTRHLKPWMDRHYLA